MTVFDNIAFGLRVRRVQAVGNQESAWLPAAELLGLTSSLQKKPGQMSGGQRQRVAMGRAIVREPKIFLMDEPLSNLDAQLRVQMRTEIARLQQRLGVTTIYVTHDQTEAMVLGDMVAVLKDGVLQQHATPRGGIQSSGERVCGEVHRIAQHECSAGDCARGRRSCRRGAGCMRAGLRARGCRARQRTERPAASSLRHSALKHSRRLSATRGMLSLPGCAARWNSARTLDPKSWFTWTFLVLHAHLAVTSMIQVLATMSRSERAVSSSRG